MFVRRFASFVVLAVCASGLMTGVATGSEPPPPNWVQQFHAARQLCQGGDFLQAIQSYTALINALKLANGPHELVARAYDELGIALKVTGRYDEAEKNYLRALDIMERADGHGSVQVGVVLSDIGAFYVESGQLARAERYLIDGRNVLSAASTSPYFCRAAVMQNLAGLYYHQGRLEQAAEEFRGALTILRRSGAEDRPQMGVVLGDLTQVLIALDRAPEAAPYLSESVAIFEGLRGRFTSNFYAVLVIAANLQKTMGDLAAAGKTCDRALSMGEQVLGEVNPRMVGAFDLCSEVYKAQHRKKEAKQLANRSLALRTEAAAHSTAAKTVDVATLMNQNAR